MNKQKLNEAVFVAMATGLFLNIFYWFRGFHFGVNNNQEELPLLYAIAGVAAYPMDAFVQYHVQNYTQISPFLFLMEWIIDLLNIRDFHSLFLTLHAITIATLFITIHLFVRKALNPNPILSIAFASLLLFYSRTFIPAERWLFTSIFDIELLVIVLICLIIYFHIDKKYFISSILISVVGVLYPIYIIPLYPVLVFSLYFDFFKEDIKRFLVVLAGYALIPAVYTIFLWSISRQTMWLEIDSSAIMEHIRAPWHYKIPSINYIDKKAVGFIILCLPTYFLGRRYLDDSYWSKKIFFVFKGILTVLIITSVIHSIIRIQLLVQISPYRIGVFGVLMAFLILATLIFHRLSLGRLFTFQIKTGLLAILVITTMIPLSLAFDKTYDREEFSPAQLETMRWIRQNTPVDALFLDYTGLDVRTNCFRSSYWEFKTIPLTADAQIDWYRRYLNFNAHEQMIDPISLSESFFIYRNLEISNFGISGRDKFAALEVIEEEVDYLVTSADDFPTLKDRNTIFLNSEYAIVSTR